jgi:hypothetical protein
MSLPENSSIVPESSKDELSNHVTIFSNGMGHFRRNIEVAAGVVTKLSIPFKRENIADALESLTVFGHVRYSVPPSYNPTNTNDTTLVVDPEDVTNSLLGSLSGAKFSYRFIRDPDTEVAWYTSTLMGLETVNISNVTGQIEPVTFVSVMNEDYVTDRILLDDILQYRFEESGVRSEIVKAVKKNFQKIKPNSTFIDLELVTKTDKTETAMVSYKIPVSCWKLRYNIRQNKNGTILEGSALIDNCTDEDWDDTLISVVTGNPISFYSPDLADINVPVRQTVCIVENQALGHVAAIAGATTKRVATRAMGFAASSDNYSNSSPTMRFQDSLDMVNSNELFTQNYVADSPGMEAKESGDFAIFTSQEPVSIKSQQSAIVPMFRVSAVKSKLVLLYKSAEHARRPFRALKFVNEATHDLGKGKCGIYSDGDLQGEAILETTKPGEIRILPYCLETGVRVVTEPKEVKTKVTKLVLNKGYSHEESRYDAATDYVVTNKKSEPFSLMIEHVSRLPASELPISVTGVEVKELEKIPTGHRIHIELAPKEKLTVKVTETQVNLNEIAIFNNYNWVVQHVINPKHTLANNEEVKRCVAIHEVIEKIDQEISDHKNTLVSLSENSVSARENIQSAKDVQDAESTAIRAEWVRSLKEITDKVKIIKSDTIPQLEAKKKEQLAKLTGVLKAIHAEWIA